jgi:hypothetical protein
MHRRQVKGTVIGLALAAVAIGAPAIVVAGRTPTNDKTFQYAVGLWGDLPYSAVQADPGVPNLIADEQPEARVQRPRRRSESWQRADRQPGVGERDDALDSTAVGWLSSLDAPAMFTPGGNDWTDCDRPSNGGSNSLERLDHERQVFFSTSSSLGRHTLRQEVQTDPTCLGYVSGPATGPTVTKPTACVENRRWTLKGVTYVTLNVQGSCNNLCDTAVMIISQADPGFDQSDPTRAPLRHPKTLAQTDSQPDGFQSFLIAVRNETIAFGKPVAYVHGDSHYFRIDKPLLDSAGKRLENFTRVETFGDNAANGLNDVQWVKALVDPHNRDVFAFQPQIVPANTVAH